MTPIATTALIVVPPGTRRPEPLARALDQYHPEWQQQWVWAGDPTMHPADIDPDRNDRTSRWRRTPSGHDTLREIDLVSVEAEAVPWLVALSAARSVMLDGGNIVAMVAGHVAVLGDLGAIEPNSSDDLVLVPHRLVPLDHDGLAPNLDDVESDGAFSLSVASFGSGRVDAVDWLIARMFDDEPCPLGRAFDLLAVWFGARSCTDPGVGVSTWRWDVDAPALIDAPNWDGRRPWVLDPNLEGAGRVSIAGPTRRVVMAAVADQLAGSTSPLVLPGALEIDEYIARLARTHTDAPGSPWSDPGEFRRWIERRYWGDVFEHRRDVKTLFPHPTGRDAAAFSRWSAASVAQGHAPFMVAPAADDARFARVSSRTDGVDLVGYLQHQTGVGNVGRQVLGMLRDAAVPCTGLAYRRCPSPEIEDPPVCDTEARFATTLGFINGDQYGLLQGDHPELFPASGRSIGYWFWELDTLTGAAPVAVAAVDEIWTATTFTARAFEQLDRVPVRVVPFPIPEPVSSGRRRHTFEALADVGERFVFGVVFDHLSVTARKNPHGVIRAFQRAFAPNEGPVLVIKTLNASLRWVEHERLLAQIGDRDDIRLWDEHLPIGDQHAFIASLDCLVSLHRSEGLGLHLAEAMWQSVPVIASRYSGNLDFMNDECSVLVDVDMVQVSDGANPYPSSARWAEPDLDQAAAAMLQLAGDPQTATRIGLAGRARMQRQMTNAEFAATVGKLLDLR